MCIRDRYTNLGIQGWTSKMDRKLVRMVAQCALRDEWKAGTRIKLTDLKPSAAEITSMVQLANGSMSEQDAVGKMVARLAVIRLVNDLIDGTVLPGVDLADLQSTMPGQMLSKCRSFVFGTTKRQLWDKVMKNTNTRDQKKLTLSRGLAMQLQNRKGTDHEGTKSMFGQGMHVIAKWPPAVLRNRGRCFEAIFKGESAEDAGGVYREALDDMITELSSTMLPILQQSPNGLGAIGENRDRWIASPAAHTDTHISMLRFLGQLMGIALRTGLPMKLNLSAVVWKKLVGQQVTLKDLKGFDFSAYQAMEQLQNLDALGVTEDIFEDVFDETFTTHDSAGQEVELLPGGSCRSLTYANSGEFAALMAQTRIHESDRQVQAIKQGLATVVPVDLLQLWGWQDLELAVAGSGKMDLDLLKKHTRYESCDESDAHVQFFWAALEGFSEDDKSNFLRFVWGRSKLPVSSAGFEEGFKMCKMTRGNDPDKMLPLAHTCFFQLDLPVYTTLEITRDKILYAVRNCRAMDGDDQYATGRQNRDLGMDLGDSDGAGGEDSEVSMSASESDTSEDSDELSHGMFSDTSSCDY
eukprot:TRINITY_DN18688_c0_g1_i2.p1 TRINITY_DN18688_c0_g1~~TRINITY_DN18688_c0_g1_i2.p1  ORF type:complete len:580 (-),score=186.68 TRINITY_DN18688_c0_g1_i2:103-1842(-)